MLSTNRKAIYWPEPFNAQKRIAGSKKNWEADIHKSKVKRVD